MAILTDLPPELLITILGALGNSASFYSPRERQNDLAIVSRVNCDFLHAARTLLYNGRVFIRNSGRASLLARTTKTSPELARCIKTLCAASKQDVGHPASLITILENTEIEELELNGNPLSHGLASKALVHQLQCNTVACLRSFNFDGSGSDFTTSIVTLLRQAVQMSQLSLTIALPDRARVQAEEIAELLPYSLTKFCWSSTRPIEPDTLRWLLGSSTASLRTLELRNFSAVDPLRPLDDMPTPEETTTETLAVLLDVFGPSLPQLTSLTLHPLFAFWPIFNAVLTKAPNLTRMDLGGSRLPTSDNPVALYIPPRCRTLTLQGRDHARKVLLPAAILANGRSQLDEVRLVGNYSTDQIVKEVALACDHVGTKDFQVRPSFSAVM